ncbi:MAG: hypothetical protein K8W52_10445 [Deltaproteobacteria bacterium]|nr:hypothetical protein [Deltaproteobacteria bacterium]
MRAALELFRSRNYSCVVAVTTDAIDVEPDHVPLRLLRARAALALRRDLEAQADLGHVLRTDPRCGTAYRLLGELAARKDELASATIFLREAQRLDPDDRETLEWLALVDDMARPTAAPEKLPAAGAAVGHFFAPAPAPAPDPIADAPTRTKLRVARGSEAGMARSAPRFATVGHAPDPRTIEDDDDLVDTRRPTASGFGQYLVEIGVMTPLQLRATLAYQRSAGIRLGAAAVALGFASAPKIEWASLAYHGRYQRGPSAMP